MKDILAIIISLLATSLCAQDFSIVASSDTILLGNKLKVSFVIENLDGKFQAPEFKDVEWVSGKNTMSSVSIINGDRTSKITHSYYIIPKFAGKLVIPAASLMTETDLKETEELEIIILENPEGLIINPESKDSESMMDFKSFNFEFPFRDMPKEEKDTQPATKPKRKLKKI